MSPAAVEAASFPGVVTLEPQDTLPAAAAIVVVAAVAGWLAVVVEEDPLLPPQPASGRAMATAATAGSAQNLGVGRVGRSNIPIRMRSLA